MIENLENHKKKIVKLTFETRACLNKLKYETKHIFSTLPAEQSSQIA